VTHHSPEAEVNTRIIQKLGLHHTYFPINTIQEIPSIPVNDIVHGYAFTSKSYHPYAFMRFGEDITRFSLSEFGTAGAMVSTPADINRYLHALYTPGILLTAAQLKEVTTLVSRVNGTPFHSENDLGNPLGYGLGIIGYRWPSHQQMIYLYNGTSNGFNFTYLYDPKKQLYLTYAVNSLADLDQDFSRSMKLFGELGCGT
jgi:D-alanyl-D-alanine carboxypeptidase